MIVISKPEHFKEALTKIHEFRKPQTNPIVGKLFSGLLNYEDEQWAQHRRMLNPAFRVEKLKVIALNFLQQPPNTLPREKKKIGQKVS